MALHGRQGTASELVANMPAAFKQMQKKRKKMMKKDEDEEEEDMEYNMKDSKYMEEYEDEDEDEDMEYNTANAAKKAKGQAASGSQFWRLYQGALNAGHSEDEAFAMASSKVTGGSKKGKGKGKMKANTMQEWLASAPPEAQSVWNNAVEIHERAKHALIERLVANAAQADVARARKVLDAKPLDELETLAALLPEPAANQTVTVPAGMAPLYIGQGPVISNSRPQVDPDDCLQLPVWNESTAAAK